MTIALTSAQNHPHQKRNRRILADQMKFLMAHVPGTSALLVLACRADLLVRLAEIKVDN